MPRGSLPWLLLAGVILTGFAVYLEATMLHPFSSAVMATDAWQNTSNPHAASGKGMIGAFVRNVLAILILGVWIGIFLLARRAA